jgi:uncharacterized protein YgiM (DUF1202 family)
MKIKYLLVAALACASLIGDIAAQEQAFTNRSTELRDRPGFEGKVVDSLKEGLQVKVLQRQGGWTRVDVNQKQGWVRVFHLRFPSTVETSSGGGALTGITSAFGFGNRNQPQTSRVATIGIRGLSEEELKNASPNPDAVRKLQSFRVDKATAERFAKEAKLNAQQVAYVADAGSSSDGSTKRNRK